MSSFSTFGSRTGTGSKPLQAIKEKDPNAAVIMMSGHGTSATAVKSIKMGAHDYLEKPLSYDSVVNAIHGAMETKTARLAVGAASILELGRERVDTDRTFRPPPLLPQIQVGSQPQRTIAKSSVIYGLGLHSGGRTGMVIQPLPPDSGIHLSTLPGGAQIPAHLDFVAQNRLRNNP